MRRIQGKVVMLNLLRFRDVADYSANPQLAPPRPISGEAAYQPHVEHTLPHLERSWGELIFLGKGGAFLIGPADERWDAVMLVRQRSVADFIAFASQTKPTWRGSGIGRQPWRIRGCSRSSSRTSGGRGDDVMDLSDELAAKLRRGNDRAGRLVAAVVGEMV